MDTQMFIFELTGIALTGLLYICNHLTFYLKKMVSGKSFPGKPVIWKTCTLIEY